MLRRLGIENGMLQKYEAAANKTFSRDFVNKERALRLAAEAEIPKESRDFVADFFNFADDDLLRFIWLFYYLQFETNEDFKFDIWQLDKIPMPKAAEEKFLGGIKLITYLLAAENLKKWVSERNLEYGIVEAYYGRIRYLLELNLFDPATYGLARLSPFLYGYAKPVSMKLGRLAYQLKGFTDHFEVYKNARGERVLAATPKYLYNADGLPDEVGEKPIYRIENGILIYQTFDKNGRLCKEVCRLSLDEYRCELREGDEVVTIHIPEGEKLSPGLIADSLKRAKEVYGKYFHEYKAFVTRTWFIDPALRGEVIKEGGNMAYFADMFTVVCEEDQHNHSVFEHVFKVKRQPLEDLEPKNSFQEKVLARALRGEKIYWTYGVLNGDF